MNTLDEHPLIALLQSPILPDVLSPYIKKRNFRGLPVDKPHTRVPRFTFSFFSRVPGFARQRADFEAYSAPPLLE